MLEVAPRPIGSLCAQALVFEDGAPLEQLIVRHAFGEDVSDARGRDGAAGVMMILVPRAGIYQGVRGVDRAEALADEVIITAKEGQTVLPLPEGNTVYTHFQSATRMEISPSKMSRKAKKTSIERPHGAPDKAETGKDLGARE